MWGRMRFNRAVIARSILFIYLWAAVVSLGFGLSGVVAEAQTEPRGMTQEQIQNIRDDHAAIRAEVRFIMERIRANDEIDADARLARIEVQVGLVMAGVGALIANLVASWVKMFRPGEGK